VLHDALAATWFRAVEPAPGMDPVDLVDLAEPGPGTAAVPAGGPAARAS
jgi:hypothetical protein